MDTNHGIGERETRYKVVLKREKTPRIAWGLDSANRKAYILELEEWRDYKKLLLSTGLFDKEMIEIYEGDIVRFGLIRNRHFKEHIGVVTRESLGFYFANIPLFELELNNSELMIKDCEIIGNIFENPELLK